MTKLIFSVLLFFILPGNLLAKKISAVALLTDFLFFSPNKDGIQDDLILYPKLENVKSVAGWELQLRDASGTIRRTIASTKNLPSSFLWDGTDDFGAPCAEGNYEVILAVWDTKNRHFPAPSLAVTLDLTPPTISLDIDEKSIFVKEDLLSFPTFYLSAVDLSGISNWKLELQDPNKQEFYSQSSTHSLPTDWIIPPVSINPAVKKFTALLFVIDKAGNKGTSPPIELTIRKEPAKKSEEIASNDAEGPFLQMTTILFVSELFGPDANYGSSLLPQAKILLDPISKTLLDSTGSRATVLGHVDSGKNRNEDKALSSYFAWRVFSYLVREKRVDKNTVAVRGMGSDVPIGDNRTSLGRARNRRIEIQFFLPQE